MKQGHKMAAHPFESAPPSVERARGLSRTAFPERPGQPVPQFPYGVELYMASLQMTTGLLGVGLAIVILYLIRRDHLYLMHGLFWVAVAIVAAILGAWHGLIDQLARWSGIQYPPALLLLLACMVLFIKALHADMVNTRIERDVRRLNQRLAMLEADADAYRLQSSSSISTSTSSPVRLL